MNQIVVNNYFHSKVVEHRDTALKNFERPAALI